jgi:hypothetical protein
MTDVPAPDQPEAKIEAPPPPELLPALARFDRGNFRGATAALSALLAGQPAPDVAEAARALLARMAPDPWALRLGLLAVTLLAIVTAIFAH